MRFSHAAAAFLAATIAVQARAEGTTTFSGKVFADYTFKQNRNEGTNTTAPDAGTALDLKRFYFTVDHSFDQTWGARFRTDVGDLSKHLDVYAKNAYLEAKVAPELVVRAGAADLPWVPFVEDLYGYRYVENVLVDRVKFGTSADWGLHAGGKIAGIAGYAISVVNGRGYGDPTRSQAPTGEARINASPVKGLTLAVGGLYGKLGQQVVGTSTPHTASRLTALVAYAAGPVRVGVDGFWAYNDSTSIVLGKSPTDHAAGGSAWASVAVASQVAVFSRYDHVEPNRDTNPDLKDDYFNAGLEYRPVKPVSLAVVYKRDVVKGGTLGTSNGTIGSAVKGERGTYDEAGVFAQYAF